MIVVGLNAFHGDVSAVLVRDGHLVAAVEEDLRGDFDVSTLWARVISMNFPG